MSKEKIIWKPGWNGKPYKGDDWIIANSLVPNRKLTKKEMKDIARKMRVIIKKNGLNGKVTLRD